MALYWRHADRKTKGIIEMDTGKRPKSVTVIAGVLIGAGAVMLCSLVWRLSTIGRSDIMFSLWMAVFVAINLSSSIAIFKGFNWGRLLYLCSTPITIGLYWLLFGLRPVYLRILMAIIYIVFLVFLVRPVASVFFTHRNSEE